MIQLLNLTLSSPAENLALDEALLDAAEAAATDNDSPGSAPREVLRLWEPADYFVVLGSSSQAAVEANTTECAARGIPILRRPSGGAAILAGPGCLMYALVLSFDHRPELRSVDAAHRFVLDSIVRALRPLVPGVMRAGTSDLVVEAEPVARKFSGNSVRIKRRHLLYHGTLLYDFALPLVQTCLGTPPRQPDYRAQRDHHQFVTNLPLKQHALRSAIAQAFDANQELRDWPQTLTARLVAERYSRADWNLRR